jgi:hypothetical protein
MKKTSKRLRLEKQVIRDLSTLQLGDARGGDLESGCGPETRDTAWKCTTLVSCKQTCAWTHEV